MKPFVLTALPVCILLSACENSGANYVPVIDGPTGPQYSSDLFACQQLAKQQPTLSGSAAGTAATTAGAAAATTAVLNNSGNNVLDAAVVGAVAGLTGSAIQQNANKEQIVRNCMRGRGYNVIG